MQAFAHVVEAHVFTSDGPDKRSRYQSRHLDSQDVLRVCCRPVIVQAVREVLGADLVLWRSNFFPKPPGAQAFEWHSDRNHWRDLLDPMVNVTAWLAVDPATPQAGCLEFKRSPDDAQAVTMALEPGEFVLFDQDAMHRSAPNRTAQGRLGLAIRFTQPHVAIKQDERLPSAHRVIRL